MQNDMALGIYDDSTRHKSFSVNNQRALKVHSVSRLVISSETHEFGDLEGYDWSGDHYEAGK